MGDRRAPGARMGQRENAAAGSGGAPPARVLTAPATFGDDGPAPPRDALPSLTTTTTHLFEVVVV